MSKAGIGWLMFVIVIAITLFSIKVTDDQYPAYTSMVSKGIYKDFTNKKEEKKHGENSLDLSKYRPSFDPNGK